MPTRSASHSLSRVKLISCCTAMPCAATMPPSIAWPPPMAPSRMAASSAAAEVMLCCCWLRIMRAMWCCVTCAVSCAITPASSDSVELASTVPALMNTKPPGTANALICGSLITKYWKPLPPSVLCEASRMPTPLMYSLISGSSRIAFWSRSCLATMAPRRYSSLCDSSAAAGLPMSGRSEPAGGAFRIGWPDCGAAGATVVAALSTAIASSRGSRRIIAVGPPAAAPSFPILTDAYRCVTGVAPKAYT